MTARALRPALLLLAAAVPAQVGAQVAGEPRTTRDRNAPPAAEEEPGPAVDATLVYTADLWRNARGGVKRGWRYLDNLDATLSVDAERALGWRGAKLFVYGLYNNGRSLSGELIGDAQVASNLETGVRAVRLYEAWVEQRTADGRLSIKAGLYDLNSEFDVTEVGALSVHSSHGIGPEFGNTGRNGPSIFPVTSLGLRADWRPDGRWTMRAAVLDGVPGDPSRPRRTVVKFGRGDGALLVGEVAYAAGRTTAKVGHWRYTARFEALAGGRRRGNDGVYLVLERRLSGEAGGRGWAALAQWGTGEGRINPVAGYAGGGLVRTGLFRSDDQVGLFIARARFGGPFRRSVRNAGGRADRAEVAYEATYRTPVTRRLTVQPVAQYIANPGADPALRDAVVLGARVEFGL